MQYSLEPTSMFIVDFAKYKDQKETTIRSTVGTALNHDNDFFSMAEVDVEVEGMFLCLCFPFNISTSNSPTRIEHSGSSLQ